MKRKNLFIKLITLTLAALLPVSAFTGCGNKASTTQSGNTSSSFRTLDDIRNSGKVVIGVFSDKAPFGYVDENGEYQGYDVYFAERIAKDLGVNVEYVSTDPGFTVGIDALGNADTIAPAVQKGNTTLLEWLNKKIETLGTENFFYADYEATLASVYGDAADPDALVVEGGRID